MGEREVYDKMETNLHAQYEESINTLYKEIEERKITSGYINVERVEFLIFPTRGYVKLLKEYVDYLKGEGKKEQEFKNFSVANVEPKVEDIEKEERPKVEWNDKEMLPLIKDIFKKFGKFSKEKPWFVKANLMKNVFKPAGVEWDNMPDTAKKMIDEEYIRLGKEEEVGEIPPTSSEKADEEIVEGENDDD